VDDSHVLRFFGHRLRLARRRASLSQEDLGQRSGVRQDTISHYETGQCRPDLTTLWRLASVLHVEIGYFFPDDQFMALEAEERETLALVVGSLSPLALQYVLTFVRSFTERQQRRHFLLQEVLVMDPQRAMLIVLDRDLQTLEAAIKQDGQPDVTLIEALVGFTSILLMSLEIPSFNSEMSDVLRRIALSSQRVVRQSLTTKNQVSA
jgi:transcriptional regulator with XRE-family HTH domain